MNEIVLLTIVCIDLIHDSEKTYKPITLAENSRLLTDTASYLNVDFI